MMSTFSFSQPANLNNYETGRRQKPYEILKVRETKNKIYIANKYNDYEDIVFSFSKSGPNKIYGLSDIYIQDVSYSINVDKLKIINSMNTDRVSPYLMTAINNSEEGFNKYFTGGWHSDTNTAIGNPTAYTENVELFIGSNNVLITVTNMIQAFNSSYPVLKEIVAYNIKPNKITISVSAIALEPVEIEKYYGLMFHSIGLFSNSLISYNNNAFENSLDSEYTNDTFGNFRILSKNKKNMVLIEYPEYGTFKDRKYVEKKEPSMFTASWRKTYTNLVQGDSLCLNTNQKFHYTARISFISR